MAPKTQTLKIAGTRYVVIKEAEYRKLLHNSGSTRTAPDGRKVETVNALEFAARSIAKKISALRVKAGLTQLALARKAGVRPETISRIERGKANPTAETLRKIVDVLEG